MRMEREGGRWTVDGDGRGGVRTFCWRMEDGKWRVAGAEQGRVEVELLVGVVGGCLGKVGF